MTHTAERYHDISTGHRVVGHENKCRHLHGHNYRIHFLCQAAPNMDSLDSLGRVIDFGVIKEKLCMWVEDNWDHKFLAWKNDTLVRGLLNLLEQDAAGGSSFTLDAEDDLMFRESVVFTSFNPTAENMAEYLVTVIGPQQLAGTGVILSAVKIEETRKCSAAFFLDEK